LDFSTVTPEMIIGRGVRDRDWRERADDEKPSGWHFHIARRDVHACVTYVRGDSQAEAERNALDEFIPRWQIAADREDADLVEIFGCDPLSYCAVPACHGCGNLVSVVRMQNCRVTEDSPRAPRIVLFDLT
jgi:hypothetical protein